MGNVVGNDQKIFCAENNKTCLVRITKTFINKAHYYEVSLERIPYICRKFQMFGRGSGFEMLDAAESLVMMSVFLIIKNYDNR